ncbi:hypothetical protein G6O69_31020 [Pseudenhygromyxa sp. WMMC2535]|uniref:hypothetical protein n=1 Tax=Pseudenhygromyxa sp. WMMC2535 TaxID=2712867 RepID=UPI001554698B|nr:hypothetical protein [Pseudenhygromyxa sp. WMMC2535]NVB42297.1 hypothetical protein [Pseudenhygromyxa sp. WMMC2535]
MPKPAFYIRAEAQDCAAEILLNGAPVLAGPARFPWSAVPAMSEWVVNGDNELGARITELGDAPRLRVSLCLGELGVSPSAENEHEIVVIELVIPEGVPPVAPLEISDVGQAQHAWGQWYWEGAPPFAGDRHSRQAVLDFLQVIHAGLAAGSVDALIAASGYKFADLARCYDLTLSDIHAQLRAVFAELSSEPGWALADIDPSDLELRLHCDGRVLEPVTRSGEPALRQQTREGEQGWSIGLFIVRTHWDHVDQLAVIR